MSETNQGVPHRPGKFSLDWLDERGEVVKSSWHYSIDCAETFWGTDQRFHGDDGKSGTPQAHERARQQLSRVRFSVAQPDPETAARLAARYGDPVRAAEILAKASDSAVDKAVADKLRNMPVAPQIDSAAIGRAIAQALRDGALQDPDPRPMPRDPDPEPQPDPVQEPLSVEPPAEPTTKDESPNPGPSTGDGDPSRPSLPNGLRWP